MNQPFYPVRDILDIIRNKGFNEPSLGLASKPGMIDETIKRHVATIRSGPRMSDLTALIIQIPGYFNHHKEEVKFNFLFVYNHATSKLRIRAVEMIMEKEKMESKGGKKEMNGGEKGMIGGEKEMEEIKKTAFFFDSRNLRAAPELYQELIGEKENKPVQVLASLSNEPILQKAKLHL